jgi:hypothetical protein
MSGRIQVAPKEQRTCENIVFHSKHEMEQYQKFRVLEQCGAILRLQRQIKFPLWAYAPSQVPIVITHYVADFVVYEKNDMMRIYDAKGHGTEMYKLKQKWFEACYPHLRIVEI